MLSANTKDFIQVRFPEESTQLAILKALEKPETSVFFDESRFPVTL
jgi:hypothetical protein